MFDELARWPVVPRAGGPAAEIALAGSTTQASILVTCCARTVTGMGGNGGGFQGLPQPRKFPRFF
jgi:hypothetical protein